MGDTWASSLLRSTFGNHLPPREQGGEGEEVVVRSSNDDMGFDPLGGQGQGDGETQASEQKVAADFSSVIKIGFLSAVSFIVMLMNC